MRSFKMIKQFVPQKTCLKCQGCCRFAQAESVWTPYLLDEEVNALAGDGLLPSMISSDKSIRAVASKEQGIFFCPFLNANKNKCQIYSRRPLECRIYPFIINRKDKKIFLAVDLHCPFSKDALGSTPFKEYVRYLTGLLNRKYYRNILKKNPRIIQEYETVTDLKELDLEAE